MYNRRTRCGRAGLPPALRLFFLSLLATATLGHARPAAAQVFEAVGERALGMGGAFVAVADDGTATYWNPAGLATGMVVDACLAYGSGQRRSATGGLPWLAAGSQAISLSLAMPAFGFSFNNLHLTEAGWSMPPTGTVPAGRQDLRPRVAGVSLLLTRQVGLTFVQSVLPGVAVGGTVRFVRGIAATGQVPADLGPEELLDRAASLAGRGGSAVDLDIGAMVGAGPLRVGLTARNLRAPGFEAEGGGVLTLHRQVRGGLAWTPGREGALHATEDGWTLGLDADLTRTPSLAGDRRMVAAGAERWWGHHRFAARAGARANTVGRARPTLTAGASARIARDVFVEGHAARGGQEADRGWGVGLRVGF